MSPAITLLIVRALLAAGLYAFLAIVLVSLWRDQRRGGSSVAAPLAHLVRLGTGPEGGATFALAEVNLLGRAGDNTIAIDDPTVSSHHARMSFRSGQWILEDLGSRNGTRVNGMDLDGMLVVTHGDDLQFGEVVLGLRAGRAPQLGSGRAGEGRLPQGSFWPEE
jgi:pSer/pThr/pTyr-binding forkhead associated (FHA) protein